MKQPIQFQGAHRNSGTPRKTRVAEYSPLKAIRRNCKTCMGQNPDSKGGF